MMLTSISARRTSLKATAVVTFYIMLTRPAGMVAPFTLLLDLPHRSYVPKVLVLCKTLQTLPFTRVRPNAVASRPSVPALISTNLMRSTTVRGASAVSNRDPAYIAPTSDQRLLQARN